MKLQLCGSVVKARDIASDRLQADTCRGTYEEYRQERVSCILSHPVTAVIDVPYRSGIASDYLTSAAIFN